MIFFQSDCVTAVCFFIWDRTESGLPVLPFETAVWYVETNLVPAQQGGNMS